MKPFKKALALLLTAVIFISAFSFTASAKPKFEKIAKGKVTTGRFTKKNKINYFKFKITKNSKVSILAYNGNLSDYYNVKCRIYKDKALKKQVFKTTLRVTDTDMWGPYKKLQAGTYYIALKAKDKFFYYITTDILPVK